MISTIKISPAAVEYLQSLLKKQDKQTAVRMFVLRPGTMEAETCLAYCKKGAEQADDLKLDGLPFTFYIEKKSEKFLLDANIDFEKEKMGGQLTIRAPNSKMKKLTADSSIEEKINYVLYTEINPSLASHGGFVSLVEVINNSIAVLRFGGGCQGCGMIDVTLKSGVEKTLKSNIAELAEIRDITDHSDNSNAYY